MISWIQKYFQKHFRLVFGMILIAMAVPLVVIYSQSSGLGRASSRQREQMFFGNNLGNEAVMSRAIADAAHSNQLRGNYQSDSGQIQQYALIRLAGLALADQLHLPAPTSAEISAYIAALPVFKDEQGNFDQKRYSDFATARASTPAFTVTDANRVFRDDARLAMLGQLLGGPGYVLPADIRDVLNHADAKWTLAVASTDYASFDAGVTVTDEALKKYYDENQGRYEVGARLRLSEVLFHPEEYLAGTSAPTEEQVHAYYEANVSRFPAPVDAAAKPELKLDAAKATPENYAKVRPQVELALRMEAATRAAMKAATDFTVALYESKAPANSPELTAFLAGQHRTPVAVAPFVPDNPPPGLEWIAGYADSIDRLNQERYFSDPLSSPGGVVVFLWAETLPAYKPALAEVHDKVAADYKEAEKRKRFVAYGQALRARLEAAVKAGTPFEKAAAAEKLEVKSYASFPAMEPPKDLPAPAVQTLPSLDTGKISEMVSGNDKGYLVYAVQKALPDGTAANPRYAELKTMLSRYVTRTSEATILNSLVTAELQKTGSLSGTR